MLKFGSASIFVSVSDDDGFRVIHGTDNVTLRHTPADKLRNDAWERLWQAIDEITESGQ